MPAVENVLEIIKNVIAAFKKFFEEIFVMFQPKEEGENADANA